MKKFLLLPIIALGMVFTPSLASADPPADDLALHCPDKDNEAKVEANEETQADINAEVIDAGMLLCIKSGGQDSKNTGVIVTDGETSLQDYLKDAGIVGGDGEGRDVSYYIVYGPAPELEAFVCFEGEIETFTHTIQAELNLLVSAFLELNVGAVQVTGLDDECEEEVVVTTTTTAPPVTTTTAPPATDTSAPVATAAPRSAPAPAPTSAPAPVSQLPHTGGGSLLTLLGGALTSTGLIIRRLFRK